MRIWLFALIGFASLIPLDGVIAEEERQEPYFHITMGACYGECPIYDIFVFPDDRIVFNGQGFTQLVGLETGIRQDNFFQKLIDNLEKHKFWSMNDSYGPSPMGWDGYDSEAGKAAADACPEYWTDHPTISIAVRTASSTKSVSYYYGCKGFGDEQALNALIDSTYKILDVGTWINP